MRKVKFRAYHRKNKEIYPVVFLNIEKNIICICSEKTINGGWYRNVSGFEIVLLQFTGFKDNFEIEIYENDIVEYRDGEFSFKGVVTHSPFGWYIKGTDDNFTFEDFANEVTGEANCYVIGNIYGAEVIGG